MKSKQKAILLILTTLIISLIFAVVAIYLLNKPSNRVIAEWEQPYSIKYNSSSPCRLMVIERNTDWSDFPYREKTYYIYIGNEYPYGYLCRFPFYYHQIEVENEIKKSTVDWSDEGVTFKATTGEVLFVPKTVFAGGKIQ